MKVAVLFGKPAFVEDRSVTLLERMLEKEGNSIEVVRHGEDLKKEHDILLSVGGDGTFLSAAVMAARKGIPVLGVNLGRLGFLSENTPADVCKAFPEKKWKIEDRILLRGGILDLQTEPVPDTRTDTQADIQMRDGIYALNEIVVSRTASSMLGVNVTIDGKRLPTYWADGLMVSTPSGSTAYSLSVGGPIVLPDSKVLIIEPVAPHNLNVRPLIVPSDSRIEISFISRDARVRVSYDNNSILVPANMSLNVGMAQFSLKKVSLDNSNFIKALSEKLFWGEDKRNLI